MSKSKINIKINNQELTVQEGTTIIQAADAIKVPIPRFCYHEKLSIAANCRMCLVEVSNASQLLPACATYVTEGMHIFTQSEKTITGQKNVMEFLLVNHPLECPICDQAGECELQDFSMQFGNDLSRFTEKKRAVSDVNLGPLIEPNMTRCIHCTRCVRFGAEIAGMQELGTVDRGENMQISTFIAKTIDSEVSGNMIDLCPVGALNSKPYQGSARSWELQQQASISNHDCIGSNINYHINNLVIKRAVPKKNPNINSVWLSDRDRFSYTGINSQERLKHPLIKQDGVWRTASWEDALSLIVNKLSVIIRKHTANQIAGLISPNASLEECYLLQKLFRQLGSHNIDHRLRQIDFRNQDLAPLCPNLGLNFVQDLKQQTFILLIGSWINKEQPIAGLIFREMVGSGGVVAVINPADFEFNFDVNIHYKYIADHADFLTPLLKIAAAIQNAKKLETNKSTDFAKNNIIQNIADQLLANKAKASIILGALAINHPEYSSIVAVSNLIAELTGAVFGSFTDGANSAGAWLAGCVPHRDETFTPIVSNNQNSASQLLNKALKAYVLLGIEPELDCVNGHMAAKTLQQAEFVVGITAFESEFLLQYSEVLLPMAVSAECFGTYVNITGEWQNVVPVALAPGLSKPSSEILLSLGELFKLPELIKIKNNFNKNNLFYIQQIIKQNLEDYKLLNNYWQKFDLINNLAGKTALNINQFVYVAPIGLYASDPITRRSACLQQTKDAMVTVLINANSAKLLSVKNNEIIKITVINNLDYKLTKILKLPVIISNKIADGCLIINQVNFATVIGLPYSQVMLEKIVLVTA